jgi:DNA mismatch repair protein MutS2
VVNASVEFNLEDLRPTYHLTIGLPGRSNALAIAQRLGMPDPIIAAARSELNPTDLRAEDLLDEIHRQRDLSRRARTVADKARDEAETMRNDLARRLEKIEEERHAVLEGAQNQAAQQLTELQAELREARKALARARQPLEALEAVEEKLDELEETVDSPILRRQLSTDEVRRAVRLGDKVRLPSLNMQGVVTSLGEEDAEVQVGMLRIRARLAELELPGSEPPAPESSAAPARRRASSETVPSTKHSTPLGGFLAESPGLELDLRGQRADEALDKLERYLDSAYLAGLPWVRIIHGKGTGKLRQAVREALAQNGHVKSFETGGDKEGGEGVTVAKLG